MRKNYRKRERGISLVMALLALMLLSAIAIGMMFISSTETAISSNFKAEETAYFAARAGVEEARDRMLPSPPAPTGTYSVNAAIQGLKMPGSGTVPWAVYILNGGTTIADVTNFSSTNKLKDDELCHDFYGSNDGASYQNPNIPCTNVPSQPGWAQTASSLQPIPSGSNKNPAYYKWARVTLKENATYGGSNSNLWLVGPPTGRANDPVCWFGNPSAPADGNGTGASQGVATGGQTCSGMGGSAVYLVTALAVTPSGGRRIVQQELAQTYQSFSQPSGMFADGTGCNGTPSLQVGGNARTGSFNSASEGTPSNPPSNLALSGGDVGANGNVGLQGSSVSVNGQVKTNQPATVGSCPASGVSVSGNPNFNPTGTPPKTPTWTTAYTPPVPPMPNPLPPTNSVTWRNTSKAAGSYGNVTAQGTVTLTGSNNKNNPAIFTINSLTLNGNCNLVINGYVTLNLAGVSVGTVLDMTGGSFATSAYVPGAFTINYGGNDSMIISGGTGAYAVINAPNSAITFRGGSNFYGSVIGKTIDDRGGTSFYWDTSLLTPPPANTNTFAEISLRELTY